METMEKMNNLSFQILEEIKELKEKHYDANHKKILSRDTTKQSFLNTCNRNIKIIQDKNPDTPYRLYSKEHSIISKPNYSIENSKDTNDQEYPKYTKISNTTKNYKIIDNNKFVNYYLNKSNEKLALQFNYENDITNDNSKLKHRKVSNTRGSLMKKKNNNDNLVNEKNSSFYTNKYSNINNNNAINNLADDTIGSIKNDINSIKNSFKDKMEYNTIQDHRKEDNIYLKPTELFPSLFKNERLFINFEIKDKSLRKISSGFDFSYYGIRCRESMDSLGGKYYFSIYLQKICKSNIFVGMTNDARLGVQGGYHKIHNTFMYNLGNGDAFIRNNSLASNIVRKPRSGDVYSFYVDFDMKFIKLFVNGNEINHNDISLYSNEQIFYPCLDMRDPDDCIVFVDKIILNIHT